MAVMPALVAGFIFCCGFHTRTEEDRKDVQLLSSYTTYFDATNTARAHNIMLAARYIDGAALHSGQVFSFNQTVGQRLPSRGFMSAKIIENGEFVEGFGGGVCQVSTTLYNAALLGGCKIREYHPHSLSVSYVPPSMDAMVSGAYFDLKFENVSHGKLYIRANAGANYVSFKIYGVSDGAEYSYRSHITGSIPTPEEQTDDAALVREGKDGILSAGYLTVKKNGVTRTTLLRSDRYAPIKRIVLRPTEALSPPEEPFSEGQSTPILQPSIP